MSDNDFLRLTEAAAELRVSERTIRRWIAEKRLPAWRMGRRVVVLRSDIARAFVRIDEPDAARSSVSQTATKGGDRE